MKKVIALITAFAFSLLTLTACAPHPDVVKGQYVSRAPYQNQDCDQLKQEHAIASSKESGLVDLEKSDHTRDIVVGVVCLILFWPACFMLLMDDHESALSQTRGEREAVDSMLVDKRCNY